MRHYKQIIIDLSVDDNTDDKKIRKGYCRREGYPSCKCEGKLTICGTQFLFYEELACRNTCRFFFGGW